MKEIEKNYLRQSIHLQPVWKEIKIYMDSMPLRICASAALHCIGIYTVA